MAKKKAAHKKVRRRGTAKVGAAGRSGGARDPLVAPMKGATRRDIGDVRDGYLRILEVPIAIQVPDAQLRYLAGPA